MNIKKRILTDIKAAKKIGLRVWPGSFGSQSGLRCCPMTAVAMARVGPDALCDADNNRFHEDKVILIVCERLDVDRTWVLGFVRGYDSKKHEARSKAASYMAGFEMGREIRKEKIC